MKRQPTQIPSSLKNIQVKAILRSRGIYLEQRVNREMKQAALPLAKEMLKSEPKTDPKRYVHFTNEEALAYAHKQIHIIEVLEKKFDLKLQQFITKIVTGFLAHIEQFEKKNSKSKDYFDDSEDNYLAQAQFDFTPLLIDQAVLAGQEALKLIKSEDIYTPDNLRKQISENVYQFTKSMLDTDRQKLIDALTSGLEQGQNITEIRNTITTQFANYSKSQAMLITRTEVARASTQGALDAWSQSGLVEGKQWVVLEGGDECDQYDGEVESLDGNFYADTTEFADGDPPLHPNCKCQVIPILLNEEKVYAPSPNKAMHDKIINLESKIDKRTKAYKELKEQHIEDKAYIKALEALIGTPPNNPEA